MWMNEYITTPVITENMNESEAKDTNDIFLRSQNIQIGAIPISTI